MGQLLTEVAQQLKSSDKKVQLIYAFNGTGKTRLSREFKQLIAPRADGEEETEETELARTKILYYNAFTEDLFYWDNDLARDAEPKLKIQPNSFTPWVLQEQGQDQNIITHFQRYTDEKLTPRFSPDFSEVTFSFERGNEEQTPNIKISKGEESNFIWSIFYSLLVQVIDVLNVAEPSERETDQFNQLEYVFVDDPVSSLDENHLIELAVDLAQLVRASRSDLKFIITTHNPLFYNVLHNEFKDAKFKKYLLKKQDNGEFDLVSQPNDSPFSYHLFLKAELERAIESGQLHKYHFNFLRNILEKTATFLGHSIGAIYYRKAMMEEGLIL
ncbi:MAG: AAA family ATPase [Caldilineaceae bacterium]